MYDVIYSAAPAVPPAEYWMFSIPMRRAHLGSAWPPPLVTTDHFHSSHIDIKLQVDTGVIDHMIKGSGPFSAAAP